MARLDHFNPYTTRFEGQPTNTKRVVTTAAILLGVVAPGLVGFLQPNKDIFTRNVNAATMAKKKIKIHPELLTPIKNYQERYLGVGSLNGGFNDVNGLRWSDNLTAKELLFYIYDDQKREYTNYIKINIEKGEATIDEDENIPKAEEQRTEFVGDLASRYVKHLQTVKQVDEGNPFIDDPDKNPTLKRKE